MKGKTKTLEQSIQDFNRMENEMKLNTGNSVAYRKHKLTIPLNLQY